MITNKSAYIYDKTWAKVISPGIRKMDVRNVAFVCSILLSSYITIHLC